MRCVQDSTSMQDSVSMPGSISMQDSTSMQGGISGQEENDRAQNQESYRLCGENIEREA